MSIVQIQTLKNHPVSILIWIWNLESRFSLAIDAPVSILSQEGLVSMPVREGEYTFLGSGIVFHKQNSIAVPENVLFYSILFWLHHP